MMRLEASRKNMLLLAVTLVVSAVPVLALDRSGSIGGVVKTASGSPAEGALVKATNTGTGMTVTVVSQAGGKYSIANLFPGKYSVEAWGGGFESPVKEDISIGSMESGGNDLTLSNHQPFLQSRSISQQAALMPEGEGKLAIVGVCTDCHKYGLYEIISRRMDGAGWAAEIKKMETNPSGRPEGVSGDGRVLLIWDRERTAALDYLTKHYGPDAPAFDENMPGPDDWVKGAAAKAVVTEYPLPAGAGAHDVAVDSKGIGWVSEGPGVIGRLDPNTGEYKRIPLPGGKSGAIAVAIDAQDRVWVSDARNSRLVRYDPETGDFKTYDIPKPPTGAATANVIRFHPNGTIWYTEIGANQIIKLDPATGKVTQFPVPAGVAAKQNVNPYGMALDKNGKVWVAERRADKLAAVDAKTGEIAEFALPTRSAVLRRMSTDPQGNVWFGEFGNVGKLAMMNTRTDQVTEYPTPTKYSGAYSVDIDQKRDVIWFNEMMADQIARFDPKTKSFMEYPMPQKLSSTRRIELDHSRGNRIWYTAFYHDTVGYLDVLP